MVYEWRVVIVEGEGCSRSRCIAEYGLAPLSKIVGGGPYQGGIDRSVSRPWNQIGPVTGCFVSLRVGTRDRRNWRLKGGDW